MTKGQVLYGYVVRNDRIGCVTRWDEKDRTLYTTYHEATVFRTRSQARWAINLAHRFWGGRRYSNGRAVEPDRFYLVRLVSNPPSPSLREETER